MEVIGYGILLAIGFYLAPVVLALVLVVIGGIISIFTGK